VCYIEIATDQDRFDVLEVSEILLEHWIIDLHLVGEALECMSGLGSVAVDEVELLELEGETTTLQRKVVGAGEVLYCPEGEVLREGEDSGVTGAHFAEVPKLKVLP
jgi:hypothetical protein